jgi:steroid 5-alpha reductase family enzyme
LFKIVRIIVAITLPAVIDYLFSEFVLHFWPHYIAAKEALLVLVLGQGFVLFLGRLPVYLNMTGGNEFFNVLSWLLLALILSQLLVNSFLWNDRCGQ